jgi:hypothetical protein
MFSFLHNVRENSAQHGLHHIQKELLSKTIGFDVNLRDVSEGIPIIKQRLHQKKILLVLDDIDKQKKIQGIPIIKQLFVYFLNILLQVISK